MLLQKEDYALQPIHNDEVKKVFFLFFVKRDDCLLLKNSLVRDPQLLRDMVFANAINAIYHCSISPPYSKQIDAMFIEDTTELVERFLPKGKRFTEK